MIKNSVRKSILNIKPYIPGKPIEEVKRELGLKDVVKLASNENPYPPSPKVLKAINNALKNINRYPASDCFYLRTQLAKELKIKPEQLVFGNGSDELICLAIKVFVNEGDEVIIAKPSFLIYEIAAKAEGANIKAIPLINLKYDLDGMKKAVTDKTKIIYLGNPDNPSGMYFTKDEIEEFLKGMRRDILIFMDEAYFEYVDAEDYVDSMSLLKDNKNIFIARTFSKIYGLAGLRIGYGIGNEELISIFERAREPFNINCIAQEAALASLKDKVYLKRVTEDIKKQREFLYEQFSKLGFEFTKTFTNFVLIKVKSDSTEVCNKLMKDGIIVRNMAHWGLNNFIRISIGTEIENKKLIKALKKLQADRK